MYEVNKTKFLTDEEQARLLKTLENDRDGLLIKTCLYTGGRIGEVLNLKVSDLSDTNSLYIRGIKNSFNREIPIKAPFAKALRAFIYERSLKPEDRIFGISYPMVQKIWNKYRPNNKKLHSLRHTFALNLYRKSKDIRLLQNALGHKCLNNTLIYQTYQYSQTELRKYI